MGRTISWLIRYTLLPIIPLLIALVTSYILLKTNISEDLINPALLAFFMVILCFTIAFQAKKISSTNPQLSEDLFCGYFFMAIIFCCFFSLCNFFNMYNQTIFSEIIKTISSNTQQSTVFLDNNYFTHYQDIIQQHLDYQTYYSIARYLTVIFAIPTLAIAIYYAHTEKLGEF
jgi:hypothetical protein